MVKAKGLLDWWRVGNEGIGCKGPQTENPTILMRLD